MANFDSGVKGYVKARAVVEVAFPIDWRGSTEIACKHCQFFDRAKMRCNITQKVVNFPDKFVGDCCPLERVDEQGETLC